MHSRLAHERAQPLLHQEPNRPVRRVLLWQGERVDGKLSFIYWPVMSTLLEGFRHANVRVQAGVGFTLEWDWLVHNLTRGDVFIWVGINGVRSQPWVGLRNRGVKRVWYQTEPTHQYVVTRVKVDEVWDFSHHNMEAANRRAAPPKTRFIPPGFLQGVLGEDEGAENATRGSDALLFLGSVASESKRAVCWTALKGALGDSLAQTYSAWNISALRDLLRRHHYFLNLHKGCETGHAPVTFRASWLLSAGKLVLSDHADSRDEKEYAGLISFVSQHALPAAYRKLRAQPRASLQAAILNGFRERFAPRALFARANVYTDWNLTLAIADGRSLIGQRPSGARARR